MSGAMRRSHAETIRSSVLSSMRYRPSLSFQDWARENIILGDGTKFRFRPYQQQVAADLFNPKISTVALRWYSGAGKTFLMGMGFLYGLHQERLQMAVMFPNVLLAEDWVKDEWMPLVDSTRATADLPRKTDLRRRKVWANGAAMHAVGANSPGLIRRLQVDLMYADEIDAISQEVSDEGDKLKQFYKRGRGRRRQFKWASSYPSVKGESKIDALFEESDACRWTSRCVHCGYRFEMTTHLIRIPGKDAEAAYVECPKCSGQIDDDQRRVMSMESQWVNKAGRIVTPDDIPDSGIRGFALNCMAHVGEHSEAYSSYLHEVSAEILAIKTAENPEKAERVFVNTMAAESFQPTYEAKPDGSRLWKQREDYDPKKALPAGVIVVTAGADIQKDRIEVELVGFGLNDETWGLGYYVIHGDPLQADVWVGLDRIRNRTWKRDGETIGIRKFAIDSGKWQDQVLKWTRPRERLGAMAVKGSSTLGRVLVGKSTRVGAQSARQWQIGTHEAKDLIYQRLELQPLGEGEFPAGYMHFPKIADYSERYFAQLTAEESRMKRGQDGEFYRWFDNPTRARNEALDCRVYAMAAFRSMRINLRKLMEKSEKKAKESKNPKEKRENPLVRGIKPRRRGGWATNY